MKLENYNAVYTGKYENQQKTITLLVDIKHYCFQTC